MQRVFLRRLAAVRRLCADRRAAADGSPSWDPSHAERCSIRYLRLDCQSTPCWNEFTLVCTLEGSRFDGPQL